MRSRLQLYLLEIAVVLVGLFLVVAAYVVGKYLLAIPSSELTYLSVAVTGLLFVIGHVYSRLKERRDGKRRRAQELFLEWHSDKVRESRIFASRWVKSKGISNLPALGVLEEQAAQAYIASKETQSSDSGRAAIELHPLDDAEAKELHFFRIYQFFERWAALVDQDDVDTDLASSYMSSYKAWYLTTFIERWYKTESDQYIKASLENIIKKVFGGQH